MSEKNWVGNSKSAYTPLGASSHSLDERQKDDYYATDPTAATMLLGLEEFDNILEPACGEGHLSKIFVSAGKAVLSSDVEDRGYGEKRDFFTYSKWDGDIVTNPPYKYAKDFLEHAMSIVSEGRKVIMFLKIQFLESKGRRYTFQEYPPKTIWVSSSRILCAKNGDFNAKGSSAIAYCWFVWEKGFSGDPVVKWFN